VNDDSDLSYSADERKREALLNRFLQAEDHLWKAQATFESAGDALEVARLEYAAIRDMVTRQLGEDPYESNDARTFLEQRGKQFATHGKFRFYGMTPGDAVTAALSSADHPLTFQELRDVLLSGGIEAEESSLGRAINAALMRRTGVQKTADGRYFRSKEEQSSAE
jgi:hypothetical protein